MAAVAGLGLGVSTAVGSGLGVSVAMAAGLVGSTPAALTAPPVPACTMAILAVTCPS